jgi:phosphatidylethanolamine-binding protein (PEBP) family uncharacterized protein
MRRPLEAISSAALLATLALTGCGSGSTASTRRPASIPFQSPAIVGSAIPAKYTCDGRDIPPPLEWGEVPAATKELAMFVLALTPTATGGSAISIDWAVAGINPKLHRLRAGKLPKGAHVGANSKGLRRYSVCPARGVSKTYEFAVYAVPSAGKIRAKFKGLQLLGELASSNSPTIAPAGGQFTFAYKRK